VGSHIRWATNLTTSKKNSRNKEFKTINLIRID